MTQEMIMQFRKLFETQKQNLLYSGRLVNENFQLDPEDLSDEVDQTSSELEQSMRLRLRNREALYLKKIEEALVRIAAGTFGECTSCGERIDLRRLEARPTATHCVACKEEQERRELVHIDGHRSKSLGRGVRFA